MQRYSVLDGHFQSDFELCTKRISPRPKFCPFINQQLSKSKDVIVFIHRNSLLSKPHVSRNIKWYYNHIWVSKHYTPSGKHLRNRSYRSGIFEATLLPPWIVLLDNLVNSTLYTKAYTLYLPDAFLLFSKLMPFHD